MDQFLICDCGFRKKWIPKLVFYDAKFSYWVKVWWRMQRKKESSVLDFINHKPLKKYDKRPWNKYQYSYEGCCIIVGVRQNFMHQTFVYFPMVKEIYLLLFQIILYWGWNYSTVGTAFALHAADIGSIPSTPSISLSTTKSSSQQ